MDSGQLGLCRARHRPGEQQLTRAIDHVFADPQGVVAAARETLGTPWQHQGRLVGVALDCVGVVVHILRSLGLPVVDQTGYGRTPALGLLEKALDDQPALVRIGGPEMAQPGDLLLMRFARDPQHCAVLTDRGTIVHSWEDVGRSCEHALVNRWARRIVAVYRFLALQAPSA